MILVVARYLLAMHTLVVPVTRVFQGMDAYNYREWHELLEDDTSLDELAWRESTAEVLQDMR